MFSKISHLIVFHRNLQCTENGQNTLHSWIEALRDPVSWISPPFCLPNWIHPYLISLYFRRIDIPSSVQGWFLILYSGRKHRGNIFDIALGKYSLGIAPKWQAMNPIIDKWNYIKRKTSAQRINKIKNQPMEWENIFANHISDKVFIYWIYKEPIQLNSKI